MTHDDEGRMQKVWYSFLIKGEADTPLTQIKAGDILKKGPKPLSTVGFCTLLPWIRACWHCNNQQKCRWISTACSLQRVKPETTSPTSHRSVPNSSDIWGESPSPEASPETNYSSKGIDSSDWAASSMQRDPSILQNPATLCPEMHMWLWNVWSVRKQYTEWHMVWIRGYSCYITVKKKSKKLKKKSSGTHRICSCALKKTRNTPQSNE